MLCLYFTQAFAGENVYYYWKKCQYQYFNSRRHHTIVQLWYSWIKTYIELRNPECTVCQAAALCLGLLWWTVCSDISVMRGSCCPAKLNVLLGSTAKVLYKHMGLPACSDWLQNNHWKEGRWMLGLNFEPQLSGHPMSCHVLDKPFFSSSHKLITGSAVRKQHVFVYVCSTGRGKV